eukprot:8770595-Pyramimonas_sp.AAC.1
MRAIPLLKVTCVRRACLTWLLLAVQLLRCLTFQRENLGRQAWGVVFKARIASSRDRAPHKSSHVGCVQGVWCNSAHRLLGARMLRWHLSSSASLSARRACSQARARIPGTRRCRGGDPNALWSVLGSL